MNRVLVLAAVMTVGLAVGLSGFRTPVDYPG
jgi:hypothetical protein